MKGSISSHKPNNKSGHKFLLIVTGGIILTIGILLLVVNQSPKEESTIFGEVKVKTSQETETTKLSNYDVIKQEKGTPIEHKLRYKVQVKKENPFLSLYHEKPKVAEPKLTTKKPSKNKVANIPAEEKGFFSITNTDLQQEKSFFKAIFRETQQIQSGKAIRIILQESMPDLGLKAGTILKGVPSFVGERIFIHITAGIVGKDILKLNLRCFDQEDYIEGLYHDTLAKRLEEAAKEGLLEEVLNLDFKGSRIAKKTSDLTRFYQDITIEKGREVFIAIPQEEK